MGNVNQTLFEIVNGWSHRNAFLDAAGVFLGAYMAYILTIAFLVLVFYRPGWRARFYFIAEAALATLLSRGLITEAFRFFYHHPRPFDALPGVIPLVSESGYSFPSGHMTFFFALALVVWYVNRRWGEWFFVFATLMGIARIYIGVHWPLDIVGGMAIGLISAALVHRLLRAPRAALVGQGVPS